MDIYWTIRIIQSRRKIPISGSGLPEIHQGSKPIDGGGLILSEEGRDDFVKNYPDLSDLIRLYIGSNEYIKGLKRYCFWLDGISPVRYKSNSILKKRRDIVVKARQNSTTKSVREIDVKTPYVFTQIRQPKTDYLAIPEVSSESREYIPIGFLSQKIIASNKLYIIPTDKLWIFSMLSSSIHMAWMRTVAGRLETRYSYSPAVYTNFPWPDMDERMKNKLDGTGQKILNIRQKYQSEPLSILYDPKFMPKELRKAHQANDREILKIYNLKSKSTELEMVQKLFSMYENQTNN